MRTKNLNLKKKIAFIASVAMIATTAAYLPAEVTKDIFTGGVTADAYVAENYYVTDTTNGGQTNEYVAANAAAKKLDTLAAFVKIDGKYVAWNTSEKKYTLINSVNDSDTNNQALLAFRDGNSLKQEDKNTKSPLDDIKVSVTADKANARDGETRNNNDYVYKKADGATALEIPYFADAKKVTLEFAALKGSKISERSITSIDIELDDHGVGRLGKQHDYVVGMSDTSNFDEAKGDFKDATTAGEYEIVDLSNLVVAMTSQNDTNTNDNGKEVKLESIVGAAAGLDVNAASAVASVIPSGGKNEAGNAVAWAGAKGHLVYNSNLAAVIDEEDLVPDSYPLMRVNGHFARVIEVDSPELIAPGSSIEINTGKQAAWNETGSKNGVINVTMGGNENYPEYAISPLVTHTSGSKKEYFVYVVKNASRKGMDDVMGDYGITAANTWTAKATAPLSASLSWTDGNVSNMTNGKAVKLVESVTEANDKTGQGHLQGGAAGTADVLNGLVTPASRYKIKKEVVKKTVNTADDGTKQMYVTQYTILNNESRDEWKQKKDNASYIITLAGAAGSNDIGDYDGAVYTKPAAGKKSVRIVDKTTEFQYLDNTEYKTLDAAAYGAGNRLARLKNEDTFVTIDGVNNNVVIEIKQNGYGSAESEVLQISDGTNTDYVQFVFTNEYNIKVNHDWADNKTDLTKTDYDEKTAVKGQKVTKPEMIDRKGFEFDGFVADISLDPAGTNPAVKTGHADDGDVDVFRTDDWATQYNDDTNTITPNVTLVAKYTGKRYDVVLNANGGYIADKGKTMSNAAEVAGSMTTPKYVHGIYNKQMDNDSFFSIVRNNDNEDFAYRSSVKAHKQGYKFLGWSTDPEATKKMSVRELEDAFPGEDKTLKLYAVYEAEDNIPVNFKQVLFDENGVTLDTDGKTIKYDGGTDNSEFSSSATPTFERTVNNVIKTSHYVENAHFTNTPNVTVTAGQPLGELPVPYEKGYDFEGWYAKTWNDTLTSVEYVKVDKDTIVDEKLFADPEKTVNGGGAAGNNATYVKDNTANYSQDGSITLYAKFSQKTYNVTFDIGEGVWETSKIAKPDGKLPATMTYNGFRDAKKDEEKLGFRRPDGEVISVDEWRNVDNPKWGSGEINEFSNWTINGKGNYDTLDSVATALTKLGSLQDVVIKAEYEDTETSKSKIFLNANDGDFYQYFQAEKNPTTKAIRSYKVVRDDTTGDNLAGKTLLPNYATDPITNKEYLEGFYIDKDKNGKLGANEKFNNAGAAVTNYMTGETDDGHGVVTVDDKKIVSIENFQLSGVDLSGGSAGIKVSSKWMIDGRNIEQTASGEGALGYTVARAGYDFTGWYTDKECTKKYSFDKYPAKGTEVILYAGWKRNSSSRYWLDFDVFSGDGSEVILKRNSDIDQIDGLVKYRKTYMGAIDDIAYAKNLKIQVQDGEGTQATYKTYVYDPELSKNLIDTSKKIECTYSVEGLTTGLFQQEQPYTTIYGRFVEEGFQSEEELVAPTNVRVVNGVVTWVGDDTAVKYQIKKIVNGKASYSAYTTETSATIKNVPDEDYQVAVIAVDKNGNKKASSPVDVIVASSDTFEAAKNVKVSDTGLVTWDAAKGAVKYQVLKVVGDTKAYTAKTTDTQIQLKSTSKDYQVIVIAFNADGKSKRSEAVSAKAFSNGLGIVTDAKYAADTKTVTWTAVDNAVKYQVLKVVNGKKFYGPYVTGTSYTFKNVPDGAFAYYVIAKDAAGNSTRGTMNKVTNHPSVTDVKLADDNKTVTFKAVEGATGYQLCKIAPGKNPAYSAISTNTTITFKNACTSGTQVYVLAFFDEAHKDASYSETIIVK